jgi:hypothetical protein
VGTALPSLILGSACVVAALMAIEMLLTVWGSTQPAQHGQDLEFYRSVAVRWLDTGQYYLPHQLDGSGQLTLNVDTLYPPSALFLFVPFVWLPAVLWWLGPIAIVAAALVRLRPARWTWPILVLSLAWPRTAGAIVFGNSDLWFAAFVWAGAAFAWPGILASMKPTLFPFGLIGIRHRSWWIAAAAFVLVNLPLLPLWQQYPTVVRTAGLPLLYSMGNLPMFVAPVVAWAARRQSSNGADPQTGVPRPGAAETTAGGGVLR